MKTYLKLLGFIALTAIIAFSACSDPSGSGGGPTGGGDDTRMIISGTFASQNEDSSGKAKFFASAVDAGASTRIGRSARSVGEETIVELEGLLEDGDITFRLKGNYDTSTGNYLLSAAASFLRYNISGNDKTNEPGTAVVQIKTGASTWDSFTIEVDATSTGTPPVIEETEDVEDDFASGIPQNMWGVWWGQDTYVFSEFDIIQPGNYYYVIDAFTIVLYVNRHGSWNVEGFTCFFEGVDEDVSGRVVFDFTDIAKINTDNPDWWINWIAEYAQWKDGTVIALPAQWGSNDWKALVDKYAALAQVETEPGKSTGDKWGSLFANDTYFYQKYRKDAFKFVGNQLQVGRTSSNKDPLVADTYTDLTWDHNLLSREQTAPAVPYDDSWAGGYLQIPSDKGGFIYSAYQGKNDVLRVPSNSHWGALHYYLDRYAEQTIKITVSMDYMLSDDALFVWQIINDGSFPNITGDGTAQNNETADWSCKEAHKWHNFSVTDYEVTLSGIDNVIYLSEMQLKKNDVEGEYDPNKVVDVLIANFSISIVGDTVEEELLTSHEAYEPYDYGYFKLSSSSDYAIVKVDGKDNVMKVSNPTEWSVVGLDLDTYLNQLTGTSKEVTISFGTRVKRVGASGMLSWQINNGGYTPVVEENAKTNRWYYMEGEWTGTTTNEYPCLFLSTYENNSDDTIYYITDFWVNVKCTACGNDTWQCSCDDGTSTPGVGEDVYHNLGGTFSWTDGGDSIRGWFVSEGIREKIADGSIKYLLLGLDEDTVQSVGGLGGIGIFVNAPDGVSGDDSKAFPWYWANPAENDYNGWISYAELSDIVFVEDGVMWLEYNLTTHPNYSAWKTALAAAEWAQIGLNIFDAGGDGVWKDGGEWDVAVTDASFKEPK